MGTAEIANENRFFITRRFVEKIPAVGAKY